MAKLTAKYLIIATLPAYIMMHRIERSDLQYAAGQKAVQWIDPRIEQIFTIIDKTIPWIYLLEPPHRLAG
jgi:hypothetical protein